MCTIAYTNGGGVTMMALLDGGYERFVKVLALLFASSSITSANYIYEGSTNMMVITPATNITISVIYTYNGNVSSLVYSSNTQSAQCYCTTNNCNANFDACAIGLNYSSPSLIANQTTTNITRNSTTTTLSMSSM